MVRCQRIVEVIEEESLLANAARSGARLLAGLRRLEGLFPGLVSNARGRGLFAAFDLPDAATRDATLVTLAESDLLALTSGERSIRMRPALVIAEDEVDEALRRIETALVRVAG
jgi:L-lysine 6-transaminase